MLTIDEIEDIRARDLPWAVPLTMDLRERNSPFHAVEDRRALLAEVDRLRAEAIARAETLAEVMCSEADLRERLQEERAGHARTQGHLEDFQGHAATATIDLLRMGDLRICRPEVRAFARLMERQLRENDHKGSAGWKDHPPHLLLARVFDELGEALETIKPETSELGFELLVNERLLALAAGGLRRFGWYAKTHRVPRTAGELADVANMIMMVADVLGCLSTEEEG